MSCEQLARSALYLAGNGTDPLTSNCFVGTRRARRINALMMLCGHYDASATLHIVSAYPGRAAWEAVLLSSCQTLQLLLCGPPA